MSINTSSAFINFTNGTPRADKIIATSNIGIGTNAPAYELDVAGNVNFTGDLYQGGAPFVSSLWTDGPDSLYYRSNVEVGTGNLFVDTTTSNVGIGTTTPAYTLDVVGNANVYSINTNSLYLEDLIISSSHGLDHVTNENNSTGDTIISTNATTGFQASSNIVVGGDINLTGNIYQNGTILWSASNSDIYYNSGNVGISNAAPAHTLSIGSNLYVDDMGSNVLVVGGDINLTGNIYQNGTIFTGGGSSLWSESGSDIYYNSGNVGISNAAPAHTLSIGSNLYVDDMGSNVLVVGGNVSVSNVITAQRLKLNNVSVITNQDFQQITNVGNVTTNTVEFTNPTTSLVASGNVEVGGELSVSGNVEVGTANLFVDTTTGNVGIGLTNPSQKLHVSGSITISDLPRWRVNYGTSSGNRSTGTILWTNVDVDNKSGYSTTTGLYTVQEAGHYYIYSHMYTQSGDTDCEICFIINGDTSITRIGSARSRGGHSIFNNLVLMSTLDLAVNDTVGVYVSIAGAHYNSRGVAYFGGHKVC